MFTACVACCWVPAVVLDVLYSTCIDLMLHTQYVRIPLYGMCIATYACGMYILFLPLIDV